MTARRVPARTLSDGTVEAEEAIASIEECRAIHVEWAEFLRKNPDWTPPPSADGSVGGPEWHDEWVARYDQVLGVLQRAQAVGAGDG